MSSVPKTDDTDVGSEHETDEDVLLHFKLHNLFINRMKMII